jgi:hypothetical protein
MSYKEEKTSEQIARLYSGAIDCVNVINAHSNYSEFKAANSDRPETETEWKSLIERCVKHLETIKTYKKNDGTTSIWTTESFTDIDAAIDSGKKLYA